MANKDLKTLTFPGLEDTYYPVDSTARENIENLPIKEDEDKDTIYIMDGSEEDSNVIAQVDKEGLYTTQVRAENINSSLIEANIINLRGKELNNQINLIENNIALISNSLSKTDIYFDINTGTLYINNVPISDSSNSDETLVALYDSGNQYEAITGGWSFDHSTLYASAGGLTSFGKNTGEARVTFNNTSLDLSRDGYYGGAMTHTLNAINFKEKQIDTLTINCSTVINGWGYDDIKWDSSNTYANWVLALVPAILDGQSYSKSYVHSYPLGYIDNASPTASRAESFSITINDLSSLEGKYYVVVGICRTTYGAFSMKVNSITCGLKTE